MFTLIVGIIIFIAVLLVLVVLAQNSKGGGLSNLAGGSSASNIIGVKKTGDLLEKLTWVFIVAIMVLSLSTNFVTTNSGTSNELLERAGEGAGSPETRPAPNSNPPAEQPAGDTTN